MDELHLPPKVDERRLAEIQDFLESVGMVAAARCRFCGTPIVAAKSLAAHAGPVCRHKNSSVGSPAKNKTDAA